MRASIDGTFNCAKGGWYQVITVKLGIRTNLNERLEHVISIYCLDKTAETYTHCFKAMMRVIMRYHKTRINVFCTLTDCEKGISLGLAEALEKYKIAHVNSYCNTHVIRATYKGLQKKIRFRTTPPAVRLTVNVLGSLVSF